jgi:hypothetical protein
MNDPVTVTKKALQAYVDSDREALEAIVAEDFHFTSQLDNRLDRKTYFDRCWPNNERMNGVNDLHIAAEGDRAWIMYEGITTTKRFRNIEVYTVQNGKLVDALVFFGWDIPHPAPEGGFIENEGRGHA